MEERRSARGERTRSALLDALEALIREGQPSPTASDVAARAGLSTRSLYVHFSSVEEVHHRLVERAREQVVALAAHIDPSLPRVTRIRALTRQRAAMAEQVGPLRRAAVARAGASAAISAARSEARQASVRQIRAVLATELSPLDPAAATSTVALVDVALDGSSWDLLRTAHRMSVDAATAAMQLAVEALLDASTMPSASAAGTADSLRSQRERSDAQTVIDDTTRRIDRLVAAVESGAPATTTARRIAELEAERHQARLILGGSHR